MEVFTIRGQIRSVVDRWRKQYPNEKSSITIALMALDLETAAEGDIAAIIGNRSWTDLHCYECGEGERETVVELGEKPDYDSSTTMVCVPCLRLALERATSGLAGLTENHGNIQRNGTSAQAGHRLETEG